MQTKVKISSEIELTAGPEDAGQRIDRWLAERIGEVSRARLQALIRDGHVSGGGTIREARAPVKPGVTYTVTLPPATEADVEGESLPLKIVYEDDVLIVVDKPAGLVVHPAAGHASGTLVNALVAHCGESLSGIGGVKRPGIVHRLDKDTSGLLVVAKTDAAHHSLAAQFKSHGLDGRLHRSYLAFVWGNLPRPKGTIDARLWRSRANRMKIAVARGDLGRSATTHYDVLQTFPPACRRRFAAWKSFEHVVMRRRRAAQITTRDRNLHPIGAASPQPRIDGSLGPSKIAPDERQIAAVQAAVEAVAFELGGETVVRSVGFGDNEQPGRIFVEAVHDPGPLDAANAR